LTRSKAIDTSRSRSALFGAELLITDGTATSLRELAGGGALAVCFMRTFRCPPCRGHARRLAAASGALHEAGARCAVVVPGPPEHAEQLSGSLDAQLPVYADPSLACFLAAGLRRLGPGIQQSGTFAYDSQGRELLAHRVTAPMRRPDLDQMVDRVCDCRSRALA
jgi:peroxiredoxin